MNKALSAAISKRDDMIRLGASRENIEVIERRIARLTPVPKSEDEPAEQSQPQAPTVSPLDAFLARLNGPTPK